MLRDARLKSPMLGIEAAGFEYFDIKEDIEGGEDA